MQRESDSDPMKSQGMKLHRRHELPSQLGSGKQKGQKHGNYSVCQDLDFNSHTVRASNHKARWTEDPDDQVLPNVHLPGVLCQCTSPA